MSTASRSVRARMYRQGLGDAFLLTFARQGAPFHMLIDCGVFMGTPNAQAKMQAVASDIARTTAGPDGRGHLDVLVATHEHWDHVSGYKQAREIFETIDIDTVWVAWTEDPQNALAQELRAERHKTLNQLQSVVAQLQRDNVDTEHLQAIDSILEFFGETDPGLAAADPAHNGHANGAVASSAAGGASGAYQNGTQEALDYIIGRGKQCRYCHPKPEAPIALDGVEDVRVFVLGPPEDRSLIMQSQPAGGTDEVYLGKIPTTMEAFFAGVARDAAAGSGPGSGAAAEDLSTPFDPQYQIAEAEARGSDFFNRYYGFDDKDPVARLRRIGSDWLAAMDELALNLDSNTNNTSLALAIELGESGKVLLFPGDAQVGNWLSWADLAWSIADGEGKQTSVTAADLLARTVLYKVGHHGSVNATLRQKGLELMARQDMVAMVPVDEQFARNVKHWNMPFPPLLQRLAQKTAGRILRADVGAPAQPASGDAAWGQAGQSVNVTDLYVDYTLTW
jgi:hypothetical protein